MMITTGLQKKTELDIFFRAAFSIDLVLITYHAHRLKILLVKKDENIYKGELGLPGQLISPHDDTEEVLNAFSESIIGTRQFYRKQLRAFTEVGRHPQGRVITIAYYGLVPHHRIKNRFVEEDWYNIDELPPLSYDHDPIVEVARHKFCKGLLRHPTVFELLPDQFILSEMIDIYQQAFGRKIDSPNFRRQARESGLIYPVGQVRKEKGQMGRRPQLYSFDREKHAKDNKVVIGFNIHSITES